MAASPGLLTGVGLVALAVVALVTGNDIRPAQGGGLGPRLFPMGAAAVLLLLGVAQVAMSLAAPAGSEAEAEKQPPGTAARIAALALLAVAYVLALGKIGYFTATALAAPLALVVFGATRPATLILAAVLCPLLYHFVFFVGLSVYPPRADWFDLAEILGLS